MKIESKYKDRIIILELTEREAKVLYDLLGATDESSHPDSPEMYDLLGKELYK